MPLKPNSYEAELIEVVDYLMQHEHVRRDQRPIRCETCDAVAHRSCQGLRRSASNTKTTWHCAAGRPPAAAQETSYNTHESTPTTASNPQTTIIPRDKNSACPESKRPLPRTAQPLVCTTCNRRFHLKCARETRGALQRLRSANNWVCHLCISNQSRAPSPMATTIRHAALPERTKNFITFLQWNFDGLATKVNALEQLVQRNSVDIVLLQETKLGR